MRNSRPWVANVKPAPLATERFVLPVSEEMGFEFDLASAERIFVVTKRR
jgi:hypothetical protein